MALTDGECFIVDKTKDMLSVDDLAKNWKEVEVADRKEIAAFVKHEVFKKRLKQTCLHSEVQDAIWLRRWKWNVEEKIWKTKSRMCIRGFLDPQKGTLPTRATTATRLSQKLVLSIAALLEFEVESLDVGNAFLDGYTFEQMEEALRKRGVDMPAQRKVILDPPANIWRHLRALDEKELQRDGQSCLRVLS